MAPLRSLGNPVSKFNDFYGETGFEVQNRLYVDDVFSTDLHKGTGSSQIITNGINLSGEGGLVWIKRRDSIGFHWFHDTERGVLRYISSHNTDAEGVQSNSLTEFNSDGFTLGGETNWNGNGGDFVTWTFRKAPGFFDVVTYTGNGTAGRTVAHNLGSVPGMIVVKKLNGTGNWAVHHRSLGNSNALYLHGTNASFSSPLFNNTTPTSTEFTLNNGGDVNGNGDSYVAYLFAHDDQRFGENGNESIIKCGTYTGDGATGGKIIDDLGFEPQWVMLKAKTTATENTWQMYDVMRGINGYHGATTRNSATLHANESDAEGDDYQFGVVPNGFRTIDGHNNNNGIEYIYIAIRRPHKPITDPTKLFAVGSNTKSEPEYISDFVVDMALHRNVGTNLTDDTAVFSRLTAPAASSTNSTAAETTPNAINQFDFMNGWGDNQANDNNYKSWMFRRAPGFMDVVTYIGNNTPRTINHNLKAVPELMIVKDRSRPEEWMVYSATTGANKWLRLHTDDSEIDDSQGNIWGGTTPTSSVFSLGNSSNTNHTGSEIVAHLFATLPGISKVGSYSGTGNNVDVDCGFTAGARFVLIKRTDVSSTGDWYVWDYVRGISSGNDPYILLNSDAAEITNTDYIDPLNSGFTVTSSAPADLNDSSGTYLFLAIA